MVAAHVLQSGPKAAQNIGNVLLLPESRNVIVSFWPSFFLSAASQYQTARISRCMAMIRLSGGLQWEPHRPAGVRKNARNARVPRRPATSNVTITCSIFASIAGNDAITVFASTAASRRTGISCAMSAPLDHPSRCGSATTTDAPTVDASPVALRPMGIRCATTAPRARRRPGPPAPTDRSPCVGARFWLKAPPPCRTEPSGT